MWNVGGTALGSYALKRYVSPYPFVHAKLLRNGRTGHDVILETLELYYHFEFKVISSGVCEWLVNRGVSCWAHLEP